MERIGLAPGAELGGYRVLAPLGQGGMGAVYRAVDADGFGVALKLLHPHLADGSARERLAREVAALQKVRHPGVARVLDAELDSAEAFVVTELVEGSDLAASVMIDGALGAGRLVELADLAEQLAVALEAVHAAGVLHRDLTPGNVMVTADGPVLIDFGIAQVVEDARMTSAGQVAGTPGYLSPELLAGAEPGPRDDWWGWAAVLAFAATGRPPFGVRPLAAVMARVRGGEPDLAGIDQRVAAALAGALQLDPDRRTSAGAVVAALRGIADGTVPDPRPAAPVASVGSAPEQGAGVPERTRVLPVETAAETEVVALPSAVPEPWQPRWADDDSRLRTPVDGPPPAPADWAPAPAGWAPAPAEQEVPVDDEVVLPEPDRRSGTVLALGVAALVAGATWPGPTLLVVVTLAVLVRSIGLDVDAHHGRQIRRGPRRADASRALAAWPWYLLRGLVGVLPAALVAASAMVLVGGVGWWLLASGRLVLVQAGAGQADALGPNAPVVRSAMVAIAVLVALLTFWFGPASAATRRGARWTLAGAAPGMGGAVVLVVLALAAAAVLGAGVIAGRAIEWWPMSGPPSL